MERKWRNQTHLLSTKVFWFCFGFFLFFFTPIPWKKMCLHRKITWRFRRWNEQRTDARIVHDFSHSLSLSFRSKVAITTLKFLLLETLKEVAITTLQFHVGISPVLLSDTQPQDTYPGHKRPESHVSPQKEGPRKGLSLPVQNTTKWSLNFKSSQCCHL